MNREFNKFKKLEKIRDQKSLFIIATEGEKTEKIYFNYLKDNGYLKFNVIIKVLNSEAGRSSPSEVYKRLRRYIKENNINLSKDELWLVIDRDKGSNDNEKMEKLYKQCKDENIGFGLSNPCFELWFLLHKEDVSKYNRIETALILENKRETKHGKTHLEKKLSEIFDGYNKSRPNCFRFVPFTKIALKNAKKLTKDSKVINFDNVATYVYQLVEKIIDDNKIKLLN